MNYLLSTTIVLFSMVTCQPLAAQSYPHDPQLLAKLQAGTLDRIARGAEVAVGLSAIIRGFSDAGCVLGGASSSPYEVLQLTSALAKEAESGLFTMHVIQTHPNYQQAIVLAGSGCRSEPVQQSLRNLIDHLRQRYTRLSPEQQDARSRTSLENSEVRPVSRTEMYEAATPFEDAVSRFRQRSPAQVLVCK